MPPSQARANLLPVMEPKGPGVEETRRTPRFVVRGIVAGYFGGSDVRLRDVSATGLQIEHASPLRPGMTSRAGFRIGSASASFLATVVWSRLSTTKGQDGKLLYRSGLRSMDAEPLQLLRTLEAANLIEPDPESLDRKRQKLAERAATKQTLGHVKLIPPQIVIPVDQLLLVQQARERLRSQPQDALKWYNRAKYAMAEHGGRLQDVEVSYREEVFAVWEYLERTIDLVTIAHAFERSR